jgi:transposase
LSYKEKHRSEIISRVAAGGMTTAEAALLLQITDRQVRRLRANYQSRGIEAMIHGNRGRPPMNKIGSSVRESALALCGESGPYSDWNVCHAREILEAQHGIVIGRATLDRLLKENGLRKSRSRKHYPRRVRRERCAAEGQMLQVDGSPHAWLEGRGPRMALMGAVDDATGKIVYASFHQTETQNSYLVMLRAIATQYGIPASVYHDRHTILRSPKEPTLEEQLRGQKPMSQVQRVMEGLGVEAIPAGSPQAKGRVERLWKTLQDRLVREMRAAGLSTIDEANAFLEDFIPRFNARFGKPARDPSTAWVPLQQDADIDFLFSVQEHRSVRNDHTITFDGKTLQLAKASCRAGLPGKKVVVCTTPEGETFVYDGKKRVEHQQLPKKSGNSVVLGDRCSPPQINNNNGEERSRRAEKPANVGASKPAATTGSAWMKNFHLNRKQAVEAKLQRLAQNQPDGQCR